MSQMLPDDPAQLQAMLAQLGGPGGAPAGPPDGGGMPPPADTPDAQNDNWLVDAINNVHEGMVHTQDSKQVSLLGNILSQLTTFQANHLNPKAPQA